MSRLPRRISSTTAVTTVVAVTAVAGAAAAQATPGPSIRIDKRTSAIYLTADPNPNPPEGEPPLFFQAVRLTATLKGCPGPGVNAYKADIRITQGAVVGYDSNQALGASEVWCSGTGSDQIIIEFISYDINAPLTPGSAVATFSVTPNAGWPAGPAVVSSTSRVTIPGK